MELAKVISEAGLNPTDYPRASGIEVDVLDRKDRDIPENEFEFQSAIFSKNPDTLKKFMDFLDSLEKSSVYYMQLKLLDEALIVYINDEPPQIFPKYQNNEI